MKTKEATATISMDEYMNLMQLKKDLLEKERKYFVYNSFYYNEKETEEIIALKENEMLNRLEELNKTLYEENCELAKRLSKKRKWL